MMEERITPSENTLFGLIFWPQKRMEGRITSLVGEDNTDNPSLLFLHYKTSSCEKQVQAVAKKYQCSFRPQHYKGKMSLFLPFLSALMFSASMMVVRANISLRFEALTTFRMSRAPKATGHRDSQDAHDLESISSIFDFSSLVGPAGDHS